MELEKAKIKLQELVEIGTNLYNDDVWREAVSTVLTALDERYNKGYQDGFHSVRYDKYMNEIHGEGESAVKYLMIEKAGYLRGYADGFKQAKFDCEMDKLDGR